MALTAAPQELDPQVKAVWDSLGPDEQIAAQEVIAQALQGNTTLLDDFLHQVFREVPVSMKEFIESPKYLGLKGLVYPNIQAMSEYIEDPTIHEAYKILGKGSGKSFSSAIFLARGLYELSCYKDFRRFFALPAEDVYCLNLSTSQGQANKVVFGKLKNLLSNSPWFSGKLKEGKYELMVGDGIGALSGHSGSRAWEGFTVYRGVLDEADHLRDASDRVVAEELHSLLSEQAKTRFPNHWKVLLISFLRSPTSFMHRRRDEIVKSGKPIVGVVTYIPQEPVPDISVKPEEFPIEAFRDGETVLFKGPSWQFNPKTPFKHFKKDFQKDPVRAARAHGSKAMAGGEDYVKVPAILDTCVNLKLRHPIEFTEEGSWHIAEWFKPLRTSYYMHLDMSAKHDASGLAMCHWSKQKKLVMDLILSVDVPIGGELLIKRNRELVFALVKLGFYVRKVTADGWQSLETFQSLQSRGIDAEWLSVDKNTAAYDTVLDLIFEGVMEYYPHPKWLKEMKELQIRGKKIDHPEGGSKDCADAVAGAVYNAYQDKPSDLKGVRTV